jgi:simple sugar transport system permease protein
VTSEGSNVVPEATEQVASRAGDSPAPEGRRAAIALGTKLVRRTEFGALVALVVMYLFFAIVGGGAGFASVDGTAGWLATGAELGIVVVPVALLMIAGEFDLSVGAVAGAASMTVALLCGFEHWSPMPAIIVALLFALAVGLFNGWVIVKTGLPSFIVTLGSMFVVGGLTLGVSDAITSTTSLSMTVTGPTQEVFAHQFGQFHISILWWLAAVIIGQWVLTKTRFGNWIFAVGGDENAARGAGVPTAKVKQVLYVATALSAALVGIIQTMEYQASTVDSGADLVFDAIIASVIGGVLLTGGYGTVIGAVIGTITYSVVSIGIYYTGWQTEWVQAFVGALLLIAVFGNSLARRMALKIVKS